MVQIITTLRNRLSKAQSHITGSPRSGSETRKSGLESKIASEIENEDSDGSRSGDDEDQEASRPKNLDEFLDNNDPPETRRRYGKLPLMQSQDSHATDAGDWIPLRTLSSKHIGKRLTFRCRLHIVRRMSPRLAFLVLREQTTTLQGVLAAGIGGVSENMVRFAEHMRTGSMLVIKGKMKKPDQRPKTASIDDVEVSIEELHVEIERKAIVPFSVYEAEALTDGHQLSDRVRLTNRILDLRTPTSQAIFRIQAATSKLFRNYLDENGFMEVHTPKLQGGATEGGASVFKVDYFGRPAFLAQSPQLAKQMCISADFERVYEVGAVFRAENSNTPRHMTEYTGLDIEMAIKRHYHEAMWLIDAVLKHIFTGIYKNYRQELEILKHHFPHEDLVWHEKTTRITFAEGVKLLNDSGWKNDDGKPQSEMEDLPTKTERRLGELVKEKYYTDYYILDKFPASARPFYTMLDPEDERITNSFDFMVRGQEILSGGQRVHDLDLLKKRMEEQDMDPESLEEYMKAFEWVAPPHAGAGIGLERLVSLLLELGNLRYATLFHRDPKSFPAQPDSGLRHPEDTTLRRSPERLQPLENLVANYGDSTNTSYMDERFQIWRDGRTGAALAFVPVNHRAIVPGNPLCDPRQLKDVIETFLHWLKKETKLKPIFVLSGQTVETVLTDEFGWKSISPAAEQRVNLANNEHKNLSSDVERKIRHARNEGVEIVDCGSDVSEDLRMKVNKRIKEWQQNRNGEQVHLSDITPFKDSEHRHYFIGQKKDGEIQCLVVLAQLARRYGSQVKWALDFPGAVNGSVEFAIQKALNSAADAGDKTCTFGGGATAKLIAGNNIGTLRSATLSSIYQTLATKFHLDKKTGFREKFNTKDDPLYICYPPHGLGPRGAKAIVDFFQDSD